MAGTFKLDAGPDKMGYKVREATLERIPYMVIIGPKDVAAGTVSLRLRDGTAKSVETSSSDSRPARPGVQGRAPGPAARKLLRRRVDARVTR